MTDPTLSKQVELEIVRLHAEFERWLRGESDDPTAIEAVFAPGFTFVSPQGDVLSGTEMRENLREARGARQIRIRVENVVVRSSTADAVVATYEEWHDHAAYTTARQSTAAFERDEAAPAGLRWCHVHETWKIPPPRRR
jgi:hypothetical protein